MAFGAGSPLFAESLVPSITAVVDAGSYAPPNAPGAFVSIFGSNLATGDYSAAETPLPTSLGGTSVSINGVPAPLSFVSPGQINAQVPSEVKLTPGRVGLATVVVSTAAGNGLPTSASVLALSGGVYSRDGTGCGASAAMNVAPDGTVTTNSVQNSAAPGDYISLYGSGLGVPATFPPDGAAPGIAVPYSQTSLIRLDRSPDTFAASYSGLAPSSAGVGQINFQIPGNTREGCAVPVVIEGRTSNETLESQITTISVGRTRGQCVDPPDGSYGEVSLDKTVATGTTNDGESNEFAAVFPEGPGLQTPRLPLMIPGSNLYNFRIPAPSARSCPVAGYHGLSAGTITIQPAGQTAVPVPTGSNVNGVVYHASLPSGFVAPTVYTIWSQEDAPVSFREILSAGSEIKILTTLEPGTVLSARKNGSIQWSGGDATSIVHVTLISNADDVGGPRDEWYALATDGSVQMSFCMGSPNNLVCSFGIPFSANAKLIVDVLPPNGVADSITAPGVTQPVRFRWAYHYVFSGLTLSN